MVSATNGNSGNPDAQKSPLHCALEAVFAGGGEEPFTASLLVRLCDKQMVGLRENERELWKDLRSRLEAFDVLSVFERRRLVALGLRLCRMYSISHPEESWGEKKKPKDPGLLALLALPGIGKKSAEALVKAGVSNPEDLLWLLPRRYDDARTMLRISELNAMLEGCRIGIKAIIRSSRFVRTPGSRWVEARLFADPHEDGLAGNAGVGNSVAGNSGQLVARWFHAYPNTRDRLVEGSNIQLFGTLRYRGQSWEMANPDILSVGDSLGISLGVLVRYPTVQGVRPSALTKACSHVARTIEVASMVPASVSERLSLPSLADCFRQLHMPQESMSPQEVTLLNQGGSVYHKRLAFEDLFGLGVVVSERRTRRKQYVAKASGRQADSSWKHVFPFTLTDAQNRACVEICGDLAKDKPMSRLLQGDVGSGKTAVAFLAAHQVAKAGGQIAILAPTEILVEQHTETLSKWATACGLALSSLTASVPSGVRRSTLARLEAGQIDILVGTHSLLADSVRFANLALVIIDEQHRFGVSQRARLRENRSELTPHLLVMTATPIPRSLALTAYGDLELSAIDEMPKGRKPVKTVVRSGPKARQLVYDRLRKKVATGHKVFVVCPLVLPPDESGDRANWASAEAVHEELTKKMAPYKVGLVHGQMPTQDRRSEMKKFREGHLCVLVATTVIEVGVDIPDANLMVIEDADHFGLAQLHQLRGRIGRGGGNGYCCLLTKGKRTDTGKRRLEVMTQTTDGFRIAEEDLSIRGPGELLGARQAGMPSIRVGNFQDHMELLVAARNAAATVLEEDPELAQQENRCVREGLLRLALRDDIYLLEGG